MDSNKSNRIEESINGLRTKLENENPKLVKDYDEQMTQKLRGASHVIQRIGGITGASGPNPSYNLDKLINDISKVTNSDLSQLNSEQLKKKIEDDIIRKNMADAEEDNYDEYNAQMHKKYLYAKVNEQYLLNLIAELVNEKNKKIILVEQYKGEKKEMEKDLQLLYRKINMISCVVKQISTLHQEINALVMNEFDKINKHTKTIYAYIATLIEWFISESAKGFFDKFSRIDYRNHNYFQYLRNVSAQRNEYAVLNIQPIETDIKLGTENIKVAIEKCDDYVRKLVNYCLDISQKVIDFDFSKLKNVILADIADFGIKLIASSHRRCLKVCRKMNEQRNMYNEAMKLFTLRSYELRIQRDTLMAMKNEEIKQLEEKHRREREDDEEKHRREREDDEEKHRREREDDEEKHRREREDDEEKHRREREDDEEKHRRERKDDEEKFKKCLDETKDLERRLNNVQEYVRDLAKRYANLSRENEKLKTKLNDINTHIALSNFLLTHENERKVHDDQSNADKKNELMAKLNTFAESIRELKTDNKEGEVEDKNSMEARERIKNNVMQRLAGIRVNLTTDVSMNYAHKYLSNDIMSLDDYLNTNDASFSFINGDIKKQLKDLVELANAYIAQSLVAEFGEELTDSKVLYRKIQEYKQNATEIEQQLNRTQLEKNELRVLITAYLGQIKDLTDRNTLLVKISLIQQTTIANLEVAKEDKARLEQQLQAAGQNNTQLQQLIENKNKEIEELKKELEDSEKKHQEELKRPENVSAAELANCNTLIEKLKQEKELLFRELEKLRNEISGLQENKTDLDTARIIIAENQQRIIDAEQKVRDAELLKQETEQKLRDAEQKLRDAEQKLRDAEQKKQDAEQKVQNLETDRIVAEELYKVIEETKKQVEETKKQAEEAKKQAEEAKRDAEETKRQAGEMKIRIEQMNEQSDKDKLNIMSLEEKNKKLSETILKDRDRFYNDLQISTSLIEESLRREGDVRKDLEEKEDQINNLANQIDQLKGSSEQEKKNTEAKISALQTQLNTIEGKGAEEKERLEKEIERVKKLLNEETGRNRAEIERLELLQRTAEVDYESKLMEYKKQCRELLNEYEKLYKLNKELQQHITALEKLIKENEERYTHMSNLSKLAENDVDKLKSELSALKKINSDLKDKNKALENAAKSKLDARIVLRQSSLMNKRATSTKATKLRETQQEIEKLNNQIKNLRNRLSDQSKDINTKQSRITQLEARLDEINEKIRNMSSNMDRFKKGLDTKLHGTENTQDPDMQRIIKEFGDVLKEFDELKQSLPALRTNPIIDVEEKNIEEKQGDSEENITADTEAAIQHSINILQQTASAVKIEQDAQKTTSSSSNVNTTEIPEQLNNINMQLSKLREERSMLMKNRNAFIDQQKEIIKVINDLSNLAARSDNIFTSQDLQQKFVDQLASMETSVQSVLNQTEQAATQSQNIADLTAEMGMEPPKLEPPVSEISIISDNAIPGSPYVPGISLQNPNSEPNSPGRSDIEPNSPSAQSQNADVNITEATTSVSSLTSQHTEGKKTGGVDNMDTFIPLLLIVSQISLVVVLIIIVVMLIYNIYKNTRRMRLYRKLMPLESAGKSYEKNCGNYWLKSMYGAY